MAKAQTVNQDISALLQARNTLLWVVTREETRVERAIVEAAGNAKYETVFWDCASGLTAADGSVIDSRLADPVAVLQYIGSTTARRAYVLRDLHRWFDSICLRHVRNLARALQSSPRAEARAMIILTPTGEVPPELAGHATVLDYPLPDRAEIAGILDSVVSAVPESIRPTVVNGSREKAIDAAVGLSAEEAANCYARSLVLTRQIDAGLVAGEKRRVIARERVLTWTDPDPRGMDAVGGLELLKGWLQARKSALSPEARAYGIPAPRGVLLVGVPGCGKSLTAKAVATAWGLPLLRLDLGGLKSKWVGDSEANIRKALSVAETVAPCVLWLDEIEKALAGATGGASDGGVSADALGTVLSWMQERAGAVFVVATANDVSALPPELLRKGRFDELFFIDLPTRIERDAILRASLAQYGRTAAGMDLSEIVTVTAGFTGAELSALIPDALFAAFGDGARPLVTGDLLVAARSTVPLSRTAADRIAGLRTWAQSRARYASVPEVAAAQGGRAIDL